MAAMLVCIYNYANLSFTLFFTVPLEYLKCLQQYERNKFMSTLETFRLVRKNHGIKGMFKGYCITFNRDVWGYGVYFLPYYELKKYGEKKGMANSFYLMFIGGLSGIDSELLILFRSI